MGISPLLKQAKYQWPRLFAYLTRIRAFFDPDILSPLYPSLVIKRAHKSKIKIHIRKEFK